MDRRREPRITTSLPVTVRGLDAFGHPFEQVARTLDISPSGARLEGVGRLTRPGRPIDLDHKGQMCGFRAVWVGAEASPRSGQIGICLSDPSWNSWKETFGGHFSDSLEPAGEPTAPRLSVSELSAGPFVLPNDGQVERRRFSRLQCDLPAQVVVAGFASCLTGAVSDISLNGCFVVMRDPAPVGLEIELSLEVGEGMRSRGLVRRSLQAAGMGIEFTEMTVADFRRVQSFARDSVPLHGPAESAEVLGAVAPEGDSASSSVADVVDAVLRVLSQKGFSVAMKRKD
jgi:PilZ domain